MGREAVVRVRHYRAEISGLSPTMYFRLSSTVMTFIVRLAAFTVCDLVRVPRSGEQVVELLGLVQGRSKNGRYLPCERIGVLRIEPKSLAISG